LFIEGSHTTKNTASDFFEYTSYGYNYLLNNLSYFCMKESGSLKINQLSAGLLDFFKYATPGAYPRRENLKGASLG
jgi:hypothetical protein